MPSDLVYSSSEADAVVSSAGALQGEIDSATSGDVIYISGSINGGFDLTTDGVVVAGNRGIGSDGRVSGTIGVEADNVEVNGIVNDLGGGGPAINIDGYDALFFNCEFSDVGGAGQSSQVFRHDVDNPRTTWRQCSVHDIGYETYGWHLGYGDFWSDASVIEYCDIYNMGRHVGSLARSRWHIRDNHIHGQTSSSTDNDHVWEFRANPEECGEPCGNAVIEHNINECVGPDGNRSSLARVRGTPSDEVLVEYNWSPDSTKESGGCEDNNSHGGYDLQIVMQSRSPHNGFENVTVRNNDRGSDKPPGHDDPDPDPDPDPDINELRFESTDATPHVWFQLTSSAEIEPGADFEDGDSGTIDRVWQDGGEWMAEGEFGPLGVDNLLMHAAPSSIGFWYVENGEYTTDPVPLSDFRLVWNGEVVNDVDSIIDPGGGDGGGGGGGGGGRRRLVGGAALAGAAALALYYADKGEFPDPGDLTSV